MHKGVLTIAIIATVAAVAGVGYNKYEAHEKASLPPKVTYSDLQHNVSYYQGLSAPDVVRYVDTALSSLTASSNPNAEAEAMLSKGYITSNFEQEEMKGNFWTPAFQKKYNFVKTDVSKVTVLHAGAVSNEPNTYAVETDEIDDYFHPNGSKESIDQKVDWILTRTNPNVQWQIEDFKTISVKRLT